MVTATIPPGYALQEHLCSGQLELNMTLVLSDGEHRITSGPPCHVFTRDNITIVGSSMKITTLHCEGEGRVFEFISAQTLSAERITFINCGIRLISIENIFITECTFQDSSNTTIFAESVNNRSSITIEYCLFINNNGYGGGGGVWLNLSTGDVSISHCTFQNNSATYGGGGGGGGVSLQLSTGDISISNCTFQNNTVTYGGGGGVSLQLSTGDISISNCTFQNNTVTYGGGGGMSLHLSTGNVSISNCTFQNNTVTYGGGGGMSLHLSTGNVSISHCTFQNNTANNIFGDNGGGVSLLLSTGDVSISHCTFQNNTANDIVGGGGGGGLSLLLSTGDVSISHCTFQNNTAAIYSFGGGGVLLHSSTGDVSISHCTFQSNTANDNFGGGGGGVSLELSTGDVSISHCTFQNNTAANDIFGGGGVSLRLSTGDVTISHCTFQNNTATDGGGVSLYTQIGDVSITNCIFQDNTGSGSYGGAVLLDGIAGDVRISNCIFHSNSARYGGAVYWAVIQGDIRIDRLSVGSASNLCITNCTFENNSATKSGGAVLSWVKVLSNILNCTDMELNGSAGEVNITKSSFQKNSASFGGAIFIVSIRSTLISGSTFTNNTAIGGAAVCAINSYNPIFYAAKFFTLDTEPFGHLILQDVMIKDNLCSGNDYDELRRGAIYFNGMKVNIFGSTFTGSQFSSNSPLGAIQGTNGFLQLHGNITFTNNTGVNGGAISLSNNVALYFYDGCEVEFSRNAATGFGGALYNAGDNEKDVHTTWNLIKCTILLIKDCNSLFGCDFDTNMFSITFVDNHAQQGGHSVYATPIYNCNNCIETRASRNSVTSFFKCPNLIRSITTTPLPEDINDIQVLSFPKYVHLCDSKDTNMYNVSNQFQGNVTTYPGRTVRLNVTSVDEGNYLSPSVVYTQIDTNGITSPKITLGPTQKAQWIGTECGTMEYQIYGPEMASFKLLLSNYPSNFPTVVEVTLLPCEPGFTLISNYSTGIIECSCSEFFTSFRVVCDASDGTVTRNKPNWIGVYKSTHPALASSYPMDYCNSAIDKVSLARPGDLCNGGRTGIICGSCHDNHSVIFGSSQCTICSNMWLITLVMFAGLGALLVAALFFLNLTVTQGTLYGLVFYANIIQINSSIFFHQAIPSLQIIVSFINLDLGIPLCFYDGMDDADKAGLQFVFPAYLLILTLTVIMVCHYCLQRSPTTSTSSCLYRFSIIIGERAVGVLCTLIYLSYSKLLRTVINIFTYSTVHLPSGDMYVWFYDGNVEYLQGKHATLFTIAAMTCTLFLLPYTFALTFIPIIEQYSEHNRLFNYLHKLANKFKPVNDAHYAPYKGEWRWWLGARLWLVVAMYSLNPVYSSDNPSLLLSIQATLVMLFMLVQANIQPFGQPLQKMDKCNRHTSAYNKLYNCLDLMYLLNYTALAMSMSYILGKSSNETQITVSVLVGLYVAMLLVTVLYHFIVAILKACSTYDRAKEKINGVYERKYEVMVPTELEESTTYTVSTTTVTVTNHLREPLCED